MKKCMKKKLPKHYVPVISDTLDDLDDHDMMEPKEPPHMIVSHRKKLSWSHEIF